MAIRLLPIPSPPLLLHVIRPQALELHSDGQSPLQLGEHVRGLGLVECPGTDEEDVVGGDIAILCRDNAACGGVGGGGGGRRGDKKGGRGD